MDYVNGENLLERLKRTGRAMTESEVRLILPQILDALKAVHEAGIWHLDLKPANIMLEKGGKVKLIDFGASKQLNSQKGGATTGTAITYTNGYAPREQMEQNYDKFGPWTDIYALGATLYTLLTNKRPPLPTDIDDDISEDKHLALPMPKDISGQMKNLVLWMLKTNRQFRPQSIIELKNNLSSSVPMPTQQAKENTDITIISTSDYSDKENEKVVESQSIPKAKSSSRKTIHNRIIFFSLAFLVALIVNVPFFISKNKAVSEKNGIIQKAHVTNLEYETKIGVCNYSGPVNDENVPDGLGEAFFNDGRYYKGNFENGVMTGEATFKYGNGDTFVGTFRNNGFYEGKYTIKEDGSYFQGTFSNGQPARGDWYDKNGKKL
jgi:serine/threonine protein kinase